MTLSSASIGKIGKLIPRLASDHDGEVVATARAIIRSLQSSGSDLHDLASALSKPPREKIVYREKVVYREREPAVTEAPEMDDTFSFKKIRATADRLLDPAHCEMNANESKFVRQMRIGAHKYKGKFRMTVKQANWFRRLVDEYLGMEIEE